MGEYRTFWPWFATMSSSKCINYRIFKTDFGLENYLMNLPKDLRVTFTKLRTCNHHLPIEKGRWHNIDRNLRICTMCDFKTVGDEYHYIMECKYFSKDREIFFPNRFCNNPNTFKFNELMSSNNVEIQKSLSLFIKKIFKTVCPS